MAAIPLRLSPDLWLPVDVATQTLLILGKRGSGKTNTAVVLAEELYDHHVPFVVLDPVDVWWGLKASGDGKGPGLGVYVFGGRHADLPLEPTAGQLMADVVLDHRISAVLSCKHFSGGERSRFVAAFAKRLYQRCTEPLHVFFEEAHELAPENPRAAEASPESVGAVTRIWKLGRASGLGGSAVTQRPASLSKNITTQSEILVVHRTLGPQDVAAIREWIKYHGQSEEILPQLGTLKTGECFVWAPDWPEDAPIGLRRLRIRPRRTFDSSATPKSGERRVQPRTLAAVDLEAIGAAMAETIERAKAEDPAELRKRVRDLERQVQAGGSGAAEALERARLEGEGQGYARARAEVADRLRWVQENLKASLALVVDDTFEKLTAELTDPNAVPARTFYLNEQHTTHTTKAAVRRERAQARKAERIDVIDTTPHPLPEGLSKHDLRVLAALLELDRLGICEPARAQVMLLSGYTNPTSKNWVQSVKRLSAATLVDTPSPGELGLTIAGAQYARQHVDAADAPRSLVEFHDRLCEPLGPHTGKILRLLASRGSGATWVRDELQHAAGFTNSTSKNWVQGLARLVDLKLADTSVRGIVCPTDLLFPSRLR